MSAGVWLCVDDATTFQRIVSAIELSAELYLAASEDAAHVRLVSSSLLAASRNPAPVVVLAQHDHVRAAREALLFGAAGILAWPDEAATLTERLLDAASSSTDGEGYVLSVVRARGGCGGSTLVAYLAQSIGSRSIIVDLCGSEAGQLLYAISRPDEFVPSRVFEDPSAESLRRLSYPHASGTRCISGLGVASEAFTACLRRLAPIVLVDGFVPSADANVLVLSRDMGSVKSARSTMNDETRIVLCSPRRGRLSVRDVKRGLGVAPFVIPYDRRVSRASDHGRLRTRGVVNRAIAKLRKELIR